jgi:streptogramin lyase
MRNTIGSFDPSTGVFDMLNSPGAPYWGIAAGPDGNIWFSESFSIGQYNLATGTFTEFSLASPSKANDPGNNPTASNNSILAKGENINATAGIDFEGAVAIFTPQAVIPATGAAYQVTVDWGDGTT